ncbi:uncharacterized protein LOC143177828 isoform X1 [Calliopsis andreniformis]|uniref:uncharacterized protein LOC143177828 isoform X1 n=1 Tax=Calliopsis andreniformis TaxID=337506 RepID=UPI003FCED6FF
MNTPVLTKQQQRHSLSAKKASAKGLRNVLAQPQDGYWPIVNGEECTALKNLLTELLPAIKRPIHSIPWSQLKHMKKEERSQVKKEALSKEETVPDTKTMNSVILGLNAITRSLERNEICCILMDSNIEPQLLIRHIIIMAQNKKVPLLLLLNLKTLTLNTIGFASAAFALKVLLLHSVDDINVIVFYVCNFVFQNIVKESPDYHFHPLYQRAYDIHENIPLPKHSLQLFPDREPLEEAMLHEEEKITFANEPELNSEPVKFTLSTNVYKYRTSRKERAFIPPTLAVASVDDSVASKTDGRTEDFISISNYDDVEIDTNINQFTRYVSIHEKKNQKTKRNSTKAHNTPIRYLPLKVKRLQGNSNRVKATKTSKQKKK